MQQMRNIRYSLLILLLLFVVSASAQHRKKVIVKKSRISTSAISNRLYETLLQSTAKVMFIDSIVVDKNCFLMAIPQPKELGSITLRPGRPYLTQYQNELGDRKLLAEGDTSETVLRMQTALGNSWGEPIILKGINNKGFLLQNFPFLAADGITLFFSAEGEYSMGGRDIFMTNFDSDKGTWLQPQNYGLPFNSPANDYLLAIDDIDTLGWLVTDRRQPEGKVCIYTFVPTAVRQNFEADGLSAAILKTYADITSIKDTWKFGNRQGAMERLKAMKNRMDAQFIDESIYFVVNDSRVVRNIAEFQFDESRKLYQQLVEIKQMILDKERYLNKQRLQFERDSSSQSSLRQSILEGERALQRQRTDLIMVEKKIRNIENRYKN